MVTQLNSRVQNWSWAYQILVQCSDHYPSLALQVWSDRTFGWTLGWPWTTCVRLIQTTTSGHQSQAAPQAGWSELKKAVLLIQPFHFEQSGTTTPTVWMARESIQKENFSVEVAVCNQCWRGGSRLYACYQLFCPGPLLFRPPLEWSGGVCLIVAFLMLSSSVLAFRNLLAVD